MRPSGRLVGFARSEQRAIDVPCGLCGGWERELLFIAADPVGGVRFRVVRCAYCGLAYLAPRPSRVDLSAYYPAAGARVEPAAYERMDAGPRVRRVRRLFGKRSGLALDVGAGQGLFLARLRDIGWDVCGTELSESSAACARARGIPLHLGEIRALQRPPASFDLITFFHSLEHLEQPRAALEAAASLLRPDGYVLVEVPNFGSWYARLFAEDWFHLDVPRHLYHFDARSLGAMLQSAGLAIVSLSTHNLSYDAFGLAQSVLSRASSTRNLLSDVNTGRRTLGSLRGRPRQLAALLLGELLLAASFPALALWNLLSARWVAGGTLRVVAVRAAAVR